VARSANSVRETDVGRAGILAAIMTRSNRRSVIPQVMQRKGMQTWGSPSPKSTATRPPIARRCVDRSRRDLRQQEGDNGQAWAAFCTHELAPERQPLRLRPAVPRAIGPLFGIANSILGDASTSVKQVLVRSVTLRILYRAGVPLLCRRCRAAARTRPSWSHTRTLRAIRGSNGSPSCSGTGRLAAARASGVRGAPP
jgi:hypothetical protein